jgi:hypothetical protein
MRKNFACSMRTSPTQQREISMKTTLLLSALAAGLAVVSTTSFAQNYVGYSQAVGTAAEAATVAPNYGYQGSITAPRNNTARPIAPTVGGPAPAQER